MKPSETKPIVYEELPSKNYVHSQAVSYPYPVLGILLELLSSLGAIAFLIVMLLLFVLLGLQGTPVQ